MRLLTLCLSLLIVEANVFAVPVEFVESDFYADAFASVDTLSSSDSAEVNIPPASPIVDLPAIASAYQFGPSGDNESFADAVADTFGGEFFLSAATDIITGSGTDAAATAVAEFSGLFAGAGRYVFALDFESISDFLAPALEQAEAELLVTIDGGAGVIFEQTLTSDEALAFEFELQAFSTGLLDVLLISDAAVFGPNAFASNLASADFSLDRIVNVPEPSVLALVTLAIGLLMVATSRQDCRDTSLLST